MAVTLNCGSEQRTAVTDAGGRYSFADVPAGMCSITAVKLGDDRGAISSLDAAWAGQAAVNKRVLSTTQALAADVTGDGSVSSFDAAKIGQYAVNKLARFPLAEASGSDWAFVPTGYDSTAVLFGDCTESWR